MLGKVYWIILLSCLLGYLLLFQAINNQLSTNTNANIGFCIIKKITNIPCPACGTTRAVLFLLDGKLLQSIKQNPFGLFVVLFLFVAPLWVLYDIGFKKKTLENKYHQIEIFLKKKIVAIVCISLVLINWIWNIFKDI